MSVSKKIRYNVVIVSQDQEQFQTSVALVETSSTSVDDEQTSNDDNSETDIKDADQEENVIKSYLKKFCKSFKEESNAYGYDKKFLGIGCYFALVAISMKIVAFIMENYAFAHIAVVTTSPMIVTMIISSASTLSFIGFFAFFSNKAIKYLSEKI